MRKKLLPLAIAAAMAPGFASAAEVSGFVDIYYTASDDAPALGPFSGNGGTAVESGFAAVGEVDFIASPADGVTTRIDLDVTASSATIEQALFAWGATEGVTVIGGIFNNPIGYEAEDAPDMDFTTRGHVYSILDDQTSGLAGDNVAGLAVAGAVGPATVTLAYLNNIGGANTDADGDMQNSIALVVNFAPVEGLDLELGYVSQNDDLNDDGTVDTAGNVVNFNVVYSGVENLSVGLDYLAPAEVVANAYDIWATYGIGDATLGARISSTTLDDAADTTFTSTSIYLGYQLAANLSVALETRSDDNDTDDGSTTQIEFIATF